MVRRMKSILITGAHLVNEGKTFPADLLVREGRIAAIAPDLSQEKADLTLPADGKLLLPGMIDCHVHCREPGMEQKGHLNSETRAAVAGGVTSIMEMPNTKPAAVTNTVLEEKYKLAATRCITNYSFYLGAANDNLDELLALNPREVCGVKLFMGASTGNLLVDRMAALEKIYEQIKVPVALHCEDTNMIRANEKAAREQFGDDIPFTEHANIRSAEACLTSTKLAIDLATRYGTRIHVLHLTTAAELELFQAEKMQNKKITAEVCPHYLYFSAEDYADKKARIKCNPSIKQASDREALRHAILDGRIDTIGTDHAPHLLEEKENPYGSAPSGMPGIQTALVSLLEFLPPEIVVEKTAHNPADLFEIEKRGYLREGYWADLVLIDPQKPQTIGPENILYKCGWSPFEGMTFGHTVETTLVSGQLAWHNSSVHDDIRGQRLRFDR